MLKITNDFDEISNDENAIVYFTAEWCNPCKQLKPHYAKVAVVDPDSDYYLVDVDQIGAQLLEKYNLKSIPQIFVMNKGEIVKLILGRTSNDILKELGKNNEE